MPDNPSSPCSSHGLGTVNLFFPGRKCKGKPEDAIPAGYLSDNTPANESDQVLVLKDTALAYYDGPSSGPAINEEALDALAEQYQSDFFDWLSFSGDQTFTGIAAITPTGLYDEILFDYYVDETCKTRVMTPPLADRPYELGHWDGETDSGSDCKDSTYPYPSCVQVYGPPQPDTGTDISKFLLCLQDGRLRETYLGPEPTCCGPTCQVCVLGCVLPNSGSLLPGVTVTVTDGGGATIATGVTGANGCVNLDIPDGTYTFTFSQAGETLYAMTRTVPPCGFLVIVDCCAQICVNLCGAPSAECPTTVTVKDAGGTVVGTCHTGDSALADGPGCCFVILPRNAPSGFVGYRAYLSDLPPGYIDDPAGHPIGCDHGLGLPDGGRQNDIFATTSPNAACCANTAIPLSLTLTDANGAHPFVSTIEFGSSVWHCCYEIPPVDPYAHCQVDLPAVMAIVYRGECVSGVFSVSRQWAVVGVIGADPLYSQSHCIGDPGVGIGDCFGGWTGGGGTGVGDYSAGEAGPFDVCEAFSASIDLVPYDGNIMTDPVGGGVTIS